MTDKGQITDNLMGLHICQPQWQVAGTGWCWRLGLSVVQFSQRALNIASTCKSSVLLLYVPFFQTVLGFPQSSFLPAPWTSLLQKALAYLWHWNYFAFRKSVGDEWPLNSIGYWEHISYLLEEVIQGCQLYLNHILILLFNTPS